MPGDPTADGVVSAGRESTPSAVRLCLRLRLRRARRSMASMSCRACTYCTPSATSSIPSHPKGARIKVP